MNKEKAWKSMLFLIIQIISGETVLSLKQKTLPETVNKLNVNKNI